MPSCLRDYPLPAPNFGKTAGIPKSPALAGGYGGAKGFSEIGRQAVKVILGTGIAITSGLTSTRLASASHLVVEQIMEVHLLNYGLIGLVMRQKQPHMEEKKQFRPMYGNPPSCI